jgi:hypothetical protein
MGIDIETFKKEGYNVADNLERAMVLGRERHYPQAIDCFTDVIISAGLLMQKDSEVGRLMRLDRTILVAKAYQLKSYISMIREEPQRGNEILIKMRNIAMGNLTSNNPYFVELIEAMQEWAEHDGKGDFYTRPRTD